MPNHIMTLDFETYSEVDIAKCGAYKYIEDDSFEPLLLAYSVDNGPVKQIDFAQGETLSRDVAELLLSSDCIKQAYNANFEIIVLRKILNLSDADFQKWIWSWRDTMFHALYCGLPRSLDDVGEAIGLPSDKKKLRVGKALIQYFCKPCKPTLSNGGRTRNLPHHDPDKWELFKEYNLQDVVTEMAIDEKLAEWQPPAWLYQQWCLDQIEQARGIYIDVPMVNGALKLMDTFDTAAMEEMRSLTGLENPNSGAQLLPWINNRLKDERVE